MEMTQFLTILLVVPCLLGGVVSVTDKEFEVHTEDLNVFHLDVLYLYSYEKVFAFVFFSNRYLI